MSHAAIPPSTVDVTDITPSQWSSYDRVASVTYRSDGLHPFLLARGGGGLRVGCMPLAEWSDLVRPSLLQELKSQNL